MTQSLKTIDNEFTAQYRGLLDIQKSIKNKLETYPFDLSKTEITEAIIERMMAFWGFHVPNNKEILGRKVNTTAADFFTETCLLFLMSVLGQRGFDVFSEKKLPGTQIRPDISIWKGNKLLAVIELKVSNGWRGIQHLEDRENQIKEHHKKAYFGVLSFWNFFDADPNVWNTKYFGLLKHEKDYNYKRTDASVEKLILELIKHTE